MKKFTAAFYALGLLMITCTTYVSAQNITVTIAGTGTSGFSGDDGPGRLANLNSPTDVCMDAAHDIYFVDAGNSRVRKISATTGVITTIAGGGSSSADGIPATTAALPGLSKMGIDATGNVYVSTSNKIRKINMATGIITTVAGTGIAGYSGDGLLATTAEFNAPDGVAVDPAGNIYIADVNNHCIRKITAATGIISTLASTSVLGGSVSCVCVWTMQVMFFAPIVKASARLLQVRGPLMHSHPPARSMAYAVMAAGIFIMYRIVVVVSAIT